MFKINSKCKIKIYAFILDILKGVLKLIKLRNLLWIKCNKLDQQSLIYIFDVSKCKYKLWFITFRLKYNKLDQKCLFLLMLLLILMNVNTKFALT